MDWGNGYTGKRAAFYEGILDACPDQRLCGGIIRHPAPIKMEEKEAGEILAVSREAAEEYFAKEVQEAVMAELERANG